MEIEQQKIEMIAFRDFHGGDLINGDEIEKATTKEELSEIIDRHSAFLEMVHSDALGHLDRFKRNIDLDMIGIDED